MLLRETLRKTGRVGIGRVVIRTRQYLCAVFPQDDALVMNLLRYPQEIVDIDEYKLPAAQPSGAKISKAEFEMAEKLIESMASSWNPEDYKDEFRDRLRKVIEQRVKSEGVTAAHQDRVELPEDATTNVVDFMSLLRKSLATNKRTAAKPKPRATSKATGTKPKNNKTAKESTAKKTPSSGKKSKARKSA